MSYYFKKVLDDSFEEAIDKVTKELKEEGFGILTEIPNLFKILNCFT